MPASDLSVTRPTSPSRASTQAPDHATDAAPPRSTPDAARLDPEHPLADAQARRSPSGSMTPRRASADALALNARRPQPGRAEAPRASTPSAPVELREIAADIPLQLDHQEMQALSRNLHGLAESLTSSIADAEAFHAKLRGELARPGPHGLTEAQLSGIGELEQCLAAARPVQQVLGEMAGDLRALLASDEGRAAGKAAGRQDGLQRAIGMGEVLLGIAAKNAAWYAAPGIIKAAGTSFGDVGQMASLVAGRSVLAMVLAATTEYPLATDGQRRYKNAGGQLLRLQGFAQAFDQAMALAMMFGINKLTGQDAPPAYQVSGFALSALGAAMQTGALNGIIQRVVSPLAKLLRSEAPQPAEPPPFAPIDLPGLREAAGEATPAEADNAVIERGLGPTPPGARAATPLQALLDELPGQHLDRMKSELAKACNSITGLHAAMLPQAAGDDAEAPVRTDQPVPPRSHEAQAERFRRDIGAIRERALEFRDGLPANDERRGKIDAAFAHAQEMEDQMATMAKTASPKRAAFFGAMAALSVTGAVLGSIGPAVHDEWLSNIDNRAAIFGVTSSVLQAFANLGQFLGGAQPGDGRLARLLKIGLDKEDNPTLAWTKNWARSVRFLLGEFPLLQLSTTFSEMAGRQAGKTPEAPLHGMPSAYTIRNVQEAFRAAFSLAFTTLALGEEAKWNHLAGLGVSALGAVVPVAAERATAGKP